MPATGSSPVLSPFFTKSTQAAVDYLTNPIGSDARDNAFQHLLAILLTATKDLYIPVQEKDGRENSAKYDFAVDFLFGTLASYEGKDRELIEAAARKHKFRYIGKRFRGRVINKIKKVTRATADISFEIYIDEWQKHVEKAAAQDPQDALNREAQDEAGRTPHLSPEAFDRLLEELDFLSEDQIDTAVKLFDLCVNEEYEDLTKGQRTQALANMFCITVQAARKRIRSLRRAITTAIQSGHKGAVALGERLSKHVMPATYHPRDVKFWTNAANPTDAKTWAEQNPGSIHPLGEGGEPIQFDSADYRFGYHQYQDTQALEGGFDEASYSEHARGYSWSQKDPLKRLQSYSEE